MDEWEWVLDEIQRLIAELPLEGSRRLFDLWKQIPERRFGQEGPRSPLEQLRNLLIRLSEHWPRNRVFDWQVDVPWTNDTTERVIGRMKTRLGFLAVSRQPILGQTPELYRLKAEQRFRL